MLFPEQEKDGFSLVELILVLAIVGLLASVVANFAMAWQARTYVSYTEAQLENDFRYAVNYLAYRLRGAADVVNTYYSSQYLLGFPDGSSITIGHTRQTLWVHDSRSPICSHVAQFELDRSQLPLVTFTITSVSKLPGLERGLPITISKQVRLRNYDR